MEYEINGKKIELDNKKTFFDFYLDSGKPCLVRLDLEMMLGLISSGKVKTDADFKEYITYLKRWETDAPRKREFRSMRKSGITVLTTEYLFEEDDGEEIINNLENTGKFASYFLKEIYETK